MDNNINNPSSNNIPTYGKNDLYLCINNFKSLIISNINDFSKLKSNLINLGVKRRLEKEYIRAFAWKIYLTTLSTEKNSSLKTWIEETVSKRNSLKKQIKNSAINKLKGDPLGGGDPNDKNSWKTFFEDSEAQVFIQNDVFRTKQEQKLFKEPYIQKIQKNIILIYCKNNENISYKQGMTYILTVLIYALYPFYIKNPNNTYNSDNYNLWSSEPEKYFKEIYHFFHDEDYFEHDLYYLFENIMNKEGIIKFYDDSDTIKPYLLQRCENIINTKLRLQDKQIYLHFLSEKLDYFMVFQRWFKCLFNREFSIQDCCILWDTVLSNESLEPSGELIFVDYIIISMIILVKNQLLKKDSDSMFEFLLHYPKDIPVNDILDYVEKIKPNLPKLISIEKNNEQQKKDNNSKQQQNILMNNTITNNNISRPLMLNNITNNFMFMQYNPMNNNLNNNSKGTDFEILSKKDLTPMERIKSTYFISNTENVNSLKQLKDIINNYKNKIPISDKNKIDTLIDELSKKL